MRPLYAYSKHESPGGEFLFIYVGPSTSPDHVFEWCRENIGAKDEAWRIGAWEDVIVFKAEDAFAFKMRWC